MTDRMSASEADSQAFGIPDSTPERRREDKRPYAVARRTRASGRVARFRILQRFGESDSDLEAAAEMAAGMNRGHKRQRVFVVRKDSVKGWRIVDRVAR